MKKQFTQLLTSEIKKAEKAANEFLGCNGCELTGYSYGNEDNLGFVDVKCEICHASGRRADVEVEVSVYMPDRRRSFAKAYEPRLMRAGW